MAGTWLGVAYGFAGMRIDGDGLRFAPVLPQQWRGYRFKVHVHGALLEVEVGAGGTVYRLLEGDGLHFAHRGSTVALTPQQPAVRMEDKA
jgi:alpha,alpha-trehalose phosphorylase